MPFEMKDWLDREVVPVLHNDLKIYSFIWNGDPPKEILVWLLAEPRPPALPERPAPETVDAAVEHIGDDMRNALADPPPFDAALWPAAVKRLLDAGFRFDFLREQQMVQLDGRLVPIFGGDGAPLFGQDGMVSVRLFRKTEDGTALILQIGGRYPDGLGAAAAVKAFFGLFDRSAPEVCASFSTPFGQA
jgi:hypothetical protein